MFGGPGLMDIIFFIAAVSLFWVPLIAGAVILVISARRSSKSLQSIDSSLKEVLTILKARDSGK